MGRKPINASFKDVAKSIFKVDKNNNLPPTLNYRSDIMLDEKNTDLPPTPQEGYLFHVETQKEFIRG